MFYYWEGVGESGEWRRCVLLLVGPREVVPARKRRRRLGRPTERTPRPHKGSGGGMFFASASSSSSAIVAAGVQRPAAKAVDYLQPRAAINRVSGAARLFIGHSSFMSTNGAAPALGPSAFCKSAMALVGPNPNRFVGEVCAGRGHGAAVPGRLGAGGRLPLGR